MRSRHKTQNIDMKSGHNDDQVNILAFFIVVASSQISPHSERCTGLLWTSFIYFRAAKIVIFFHLTILLYVFSYFPLLIMPYKRKRGLTKKY